MSLISGPHSPRPTRLVAYASPVALPIPSQGSLLDRAGSPLARRASHPLTDSQDFSNSSHHSIPLDQRFLLALFFTTRERFRVDTADADVYTASDESQSPSTNC